MAEAVFLLAMVAGARLVYSLVSLCISSARDRAWARALATLLRAARQGDVIQYARYDGFVMVTRAVADGPARAAGR